MGSDDARRLTERYDRDAEAYRDLWAPVLLEASGPLARALSGPGVRTGLDVGAGVGSLLPALREWMPDARWILLDRSRGMLALAPPEAPRIVADATRLPARSSSVERVVMAFMLFHLERPIEGLREARRVLRPAGRLGLLTWGGELESPATRIWGECLDAHGAPPADPAGAARLETCDSPEKLERLLAPAGFSRVRAWRDELTVQRTAEDLIRMRTRMGSSKPRYDALDEGARAACLDRARRRMSALAPGDFTVRGEVVCAVAEAEGGAE